jgi:hypothetical protein
MRCGQKDEESAFAIRASYACIQFENTSPLRGTIWEDAIQNEGDMANTGSAIYI